VFSTKSGLDVIARFDVHILTRTTGFLTEHSERSTFAYWASVRSLRNWIQTGEFLKEFKKHSDAVSCFLLVDYQRTQGGHSYLQVSLPLHT